MTDGAATTTGGTPGPGGTPAPGGATTNGLAAGGTPGDAPDDLAELKRALKAEREARRTAEAQATDLGTRVRALETKDLPEAERTARERDELREKSKGWDQRERALRLEIAVVRQAARLGFADPEDALADLMRRQDDVEWSKDGDAKNVDALLADLLKRKPYLSAAQRPAGSADGGARGGAQPSDMNAALRRAAGRA